MSRKIGWRGSNCPKVLIVGECPSASDVTYGKPFTGIEEVLLKEWMDKVGIRSDEVRVGHVLSERPLGGDVMRHIATHRKVISSHIMIDGKWVDEDLEKGRDDLRKIIDEYKPNVIVALGNLALWSLTGHWVIQDWRGSLLVNTLSDHPAKVIPTISPFKVNISYEWYSIVEKDFWRVAKERHSLEMPERREDFLIRPSFNLVVNTLRWLLDKASSSEGLDLSCDIEPRAGHIACVGLGWSSHNAICIPFMDSDNPEGYWSNSDELTIQLLLLDLLTHPNCRLIGQGFHYDLQFFWKHLKYEPNLQWDTMIIHHSLFPSGGDDVMKKDLGFLSSIYCKDHVWWKSNEMYEWEVEEDLWVGNCRDCVKTWDIAQAQKKMIAKNGDQQARVSEFQQDMFWPVWEMMKTGMDVDKAKKSAYKKSIDVAIKAREQWFIDVLGHPLNINSPVQLKKLFYTDLAQKKVTKRGPKGRGMVVSCDDSALEKVVEREPMLKPFVTRIQEIKLLKGVMTDFLDAKIDSDRKLRSSFNIAGSKDYSVASGETAFGTGVGFQGLPFPDDQDIDGLTLSDVRSMIVPPDGMTIFELSVDDLCLHEFDELDIQQQFIGRRYVENVFGYRLHLLGRMSGKTIQEAMSWIKTSTSAIILNSILKNITRNVPEAKLINLVQGRLVGYFPTAQRDILLPKITAEAQIVVPYPSKLIAPVTLKTSEVSWGDVR